MSGFPGSGRSTALPKVARYCEVGHRRERGRALVLEKVFSIGRPWTDQGIKGAKDADKRGAAARRVAERMGGRVLSAYVTTGQYDVIATLDMPNGEAMAKFALAITAAGNARTTTVQAFPIEEFAKLTAEMPVM